MQSKTIGLLLALSFIGGTLFGWAERGPYAPKAMVLVPIALLAIAIGRTRGSE